MLPNPLCFGFLSYTVGNVPGCCSLAPILNRALFRLLFRVIGLSALPALLHWFVPGFEWDGHYVLVLVEGCAYVCC